MAHPLIDRAFYDAIVNYDNDDAAQEHYDRVMNTLVERDGNWDTVRHQILRAYAMLFCDDIGAVAGQAAGPEQVEATADRLYTGKMAFDPGHWYRMQHHFPVIDEDNYDRFAALVIADLSAGPLHDAAVNGGDMLLVGEADPLHMTRDQRAHQKARVVDLGGMGE